MSKRRAKPFMVFAFPDEGGQLWEEPGFELHKVGDRWLPSPVTYQSAGADGQPGYEFRFEIWEAVPVCTEVKLTAKPDERVHIRSKDVKAVARRLEDDLHRWLAFLAYERNPNGPGLVRRSGQARSADALKVVESARGTVRRKMTPEFLQSVADTYQAASGPGVEAVAAVFEVQTRQAWRYIEKAREAGLLERGER
jgi:hypothetical protein